jgi:hypothetical protein
VKTTKYILKTENGMFLGSPTNTLTKNIQTAAVFNPYQNPPLETAARYGVRFGKMTPMELIPLGGGIFPKYELKKIQAPITAGDQVFIKPEFQDAGDDKFIWQALEDEDGGRVRIAPINIGLPIIPNQIIETRMLEAAL